MTYELEYNIETYTIGDSFKTGYIWFEVNLPYTEDQIYFDTGAMNWMSTDSGYQWTLTKNPDGTQKLKCAKYLKLAGENATSIPGKGTVVIAIVRVRAMDNNATIQPTFYAYMDHSKAVTEGDVCPDHRSEVNGGLECQKAVPDEVVVTTAPSYNIQLRPINDTAAYKEAVWDFSSGNGNALNQSAGNVKGRVVGFGITLQLYNTETNKGIKGIEYPSGDITFDIDMSSGYLVGGNPEESLDSQDVYHPLVWSYGPSSDGASFDGRDMSGTYGTTYLAAPYNASGKTLATDGPVLNPDNCESCWNGGTWEMSQTGRKITVTVKDYEINPNWFPTKNVAEDGQEYKENKNKGCFSAGELYVVVPYGEGTDYLVDKYGSGTVQLRLTASNLSATSKSGVSVTEQANNADDTAAKGVGLTTPGTYVNRIYYANSNIPYIGYHEDCDEEGAGDCYRNGKDESAIGNGVAIIWGGISYAQSAEENRVEAGDFLMKFDEYDGTDPSITGIDMPEDEDITDSPYQILHQDAGFYLVEKIAVSGKKTWADDNDKDGKRPESITIHLYADGKKIESKTITAEDDWSWIFTDLPKEKYGVEIVYTIKEDKVEGYTTEYDGYNVKNTYVPEEPEDPEEPKDPDDPEEPEDPEDPKTPGNPPSPTPPAPPARPEVPDTGDDAPLGLWAVLMVMGIAGLSFAGVSVFRKKKKED